MCKVHVFIPTCLFRWSLLADSVETLRFACAIKEIGEPWRRCRFICSASEPDALETAVAILSVAMVTSSTVGVALGQKGSFCGRLHQAFQQRQYACVCLSYSTYAQALSAIELGQRVWQIKLCNRLKAPRGLMPKRRHNSRRLAPSWRARVTNSSRRLMAYRLLQGIVTLPASNVPAGVHHVCSPYTVPGIASFNAP